MMKLLRGWLLLVGLIQASAVIAVLMPKAWMDYCAHLMQVEPLPDSPLAGYLARLSSAMYVVHGLVHLSIAWQLPRSMVLVIPAGCISLVLGLLMLYVDAVESMPAAWTALEVITIFFVGIITIALGILSKPKP